MDTTVKPKTETEHLFADLDKPSLHALSYVLRHPETWPEQFVWNYGNCSHCAMGLAHMLWKEIPRTQKKTAATVMARTFGIPYSIANSIFMGVDPKGPDGVAEWACRQTTQVHIGTKRLGLFQSEPVKLITHSSYPIKHREITPDQIADEIDRYLATVE